MFIVLDELNYSNPLQMCIVSRLKVNISLNHNHENAYFGNN